MRINRLAILILLVGCKAATLTSTSKYSEDLSIHRPVMMDEMKEDNRLEKKTLEEAYTPLTGHIKNELDSIARVAYAENKAGKYVDGYVIQVYSGSSREEANNTRSRMYELFPELEPKVSYHQPNFRVKAGRFTDRLKANRIHEQVKKDFPRALLIPDRFLQKYE
ncbi:SPOR domain-containing protein [Ekhidna sp.]|uniref:SPOR domain-containing protein n=1 Tax=Ekhidna sp. TaxID=2608089 RepID=UPI003513FDA2